MRKNKVQITNLSNQNWKGNFKKDFKRETLEIIYQMIFDTSLTQRHIIFPSLVHISSPSTVI